MSEIASNKIYALIIKKPGLLAREIANELGVSRKVINSTIYKNLRNKVFKTDSHRWYVNGSIAPSNAAKKNRDKSDEFSEKEVNFIDAQFPGHSLFSLEYEGDKRILLHLNKNHDFFSKSYAGLDTTGQNAIDTIFASLARVMEKHYSDADFIEELVDDWGAVLKSYYK